MRILNNHPQLQRLGINNPNRIFWQLNTAQLYEEIISRHEGLVAHLGPLVVRTGNHLSRAHDDRFIVNEAPFSDSISWGEVNRPISVRHFDNLLAKMTGFFQGIDVYMQDVYARVNQQDRMPIRIISETAWHNLFTRNSYLYADELDDFYPDFTIIHSPTFRANPKLDGTNSETFIIISLSRRLILIGGTSYAGEIKKAIFSVMNYLLPRNDILSMECAANMSQQHDNVALFLGIFGTGKTTLSSDPDRVLIGESELGWDANGIFNIGRGCYTTAYGVTPETDPRTYEACRRFGTILENVALDVSTRHIDLTDDMFTRNTHACYPISHVSTATREGIAQHPEHIIMLTMDAFGVIPPVSKLTYEQAHFHFLSGYTSEIVDNHNDIVEPQARFSACYGAPFMPLHPGQYARLFVEKVREHHVHVWLVNTGWVGGSYNTGKRIPLAQTRAIIQAILNGDLNDAETVREPYFGLNIPVNVPSLENIAVLPAEAWSNQAAYEDMAKALVKDFENNFSQYVDNVDPHLLASQPALG